MSNCNCENKPINPYVPRPHAPCEPIGVKPTCSPTCACKPFKTIVLAAQLGTDAEGEPYAPTFGNYTNALVHYQANGANVFYDTIGQYTRLNDYTDIYARIAELQQAVDTLEGTTTALSSSLQAETEAREQGDTTLNDAIVKTAEMLQQNIDAEVNAREADRDNLQTNINNEVEAREAAIKNLQEQIDELKNPS